MRCVRGRMPQRSHSPTLGWIPFEKLAARYDAWFDTERGRRLFRIETRCIRDLLVDMPRPWLEVGVGTGRFAAALDVTEGIDPSAAVLRYAGRRGIRVLIGEAEALPYAKTRFGVALLIVTVCFLRDPPRAFTECRRILKPNGRLVLGVVPKDSPWGKAYAKKGEHGHPFYSVSSFYTCRELTRLVEQSGFRLERAESCLFAGPENDAPRDAPPRKTIAENAGFVAMRFRQTNG